MMVTREHPSPSKQQSVREWIQCQPNTLKKMLSGCYQNDEKNVLVPEGNLVAYLPYGKWASCFADERATLQALFKDIRVLDKRGRTNIIWAETPFAYAVTVSLPFVDRARND
ncbi:hypothetical protein AVEN_13638-1 [Araneus ventricosus]|uniref:Uncharacterized protein n=1 Tax=Araneus ventricosus TaxID=182803 RepID=A0A4Y2SJ86_ARAVE|nr:hypothetical protein AVEN_13638-1 [Araneus ventricosus]